MSIFRLGGQRGFSPIEILLAATVFGMLVTGLIGAIVYGRSSTAYSGDRERAMALAEEGLEAVRNLRDNNYANLIDDPSWGLTKTGSPLAWALSGNSDTVGIYTRVVSVSSVDTTRKAVTVTVSWNKQVGGQASVTASTRLTNWMATIIPPITPGPVIMAYTKGQQIPFSRVWNGTAWGAEVQASSAVNTINYVVIKSSRTRNEAIMGMQDATGNQFVQIWNGTTWGAVTNLGQSASTTTRTFDIAYEKNGDRAVIVYNLSGATADFSYRTWNGTTLSGATAVTTPPTTGAMRWMELDQNPLTASNEIAMIMMDANADVYGMIWNGTTWVTGGVAAVWDATASASVTRKYIDVEYEQTSGEAIFVWGDSVATDQYYKTWNGTAISALNTLLDVANAGGVTDWLQLASRPGSNEIMLGVQDAGGDLNTVLWSGSAWGANHAEHDATVENIAGRNFDIIWETHSTNLGDAWLLWGDQATVTTRQWTAGAWQTANTLAGSDDTSFVRLRADATSGAVFAGIYEDSTSATDDIWESRLTGGSATWTAKNTIWGGATIAAPGFFRIDIATP